MEKTNFEITQDEQRIQTLQVKNLSDVCGFQFDQNKIGGKHIILCGKKRRWGGSYKRYAVTSDDGSLFNDVKHILASGGKIFAIQ